MKFSSRVQQLIEAARCLGVGQKSNDADMIKYWDAQVTQLAEQMNNLNSEMENQISSKTRSLQHDTIVELRRECAQWKANHDNVVAKLRLFTQRPDLPVDRIPAYRLVLEVEARNANALREAVSAIYFDDGSKFRGALFGVIRSLQPGFDLLVEASPAKAYKILEVANGQHSPS